MADDVGTDPTRVKLEAMHADLRMIAADVISSRESIERKIDDVKDLHARMSRVESKLTRRARRRG